MKPIPILFIVLLSSIGAVAQPNGIEVGITEAQFLLKFARFKYAKINDSTYRIADLKWVESKGNLYVNLDTNKVVKGWSWHVKEVGGRNALVKIMHALDKKYGKGGKLYENEEDQVYWVKKEYMLSLDLSDPDDIVLTGIWLK